MEFYGFLLIFASSLIYNFKTNLFQFIGGSPKVCFSNVNTSCKQKIIANLVTNKN